MTKKAKIIAGVVGGVLVVGGIGSAFNKDKDEGSNSEDSNKIYTIDEFCTRFENEKNFAHDHKDQIFTVSGTVDDKMIYTLYFESGFKSEKWHTNYYISCDFEDKELIKDIAESTNATISGKLSSIATSRITLKDCTVVAYEKPGNNSSSDETSNNSTSEQSGESEQSSTAESDLQFSEPPVSSSESSSTTESESQSTIQESESSSEVSSVPSSVSDPEQNSISSSSSNNNVQQTTTGYILNTNTKVFHYPKCSSVSTIKDEHKASASSRDEAINSGYKPCGRCKP